MATYRVKPKRSTRRRRASKRYTLEETLLNEEERAALKVIRSEGEDDDGVEPGASNWTGVCRPAKCRQVCCNIGAVTVIIMAVLFFIGLSVFVIAHFPSSFPNYQPNQNRTYQIIRQVSSFVLYGGLFGVLGGASNFLILVILFYRIPLIYGSGVFQRKYLQIGDILRKIILQMLFDNEHLERYFIQRINQFSADTNIVECITTAVNSRTAEKIIDNHLTNLYKEPESYHLVAIGVTRDKLKPMIGPAVLSVCAEAAPIVLGQLHSRGGTSGQSVSVPDIREAMDRFLRYRVKELTSKTIGQFMKDILFHQLTGLIAYGSITGLVIGIIAQALRIAINPDIAINN